VGSNPTPSAINKGRNGKKAKRQEPMGLQYINKNCEIYLGEDSAYREDMGSLPLDCIITAEEYNALPEEEKKNYEVLVPKPEK
jgi:hypothetical protein